MGISIIDYKVDLERGMYVQAAPPDFSNVEHLPEMTVSLLHKSVEFDVYRDRDLSTLLN